MKELFGEARTRILLWYITIMTCFLGFSVPIFSQLILKEVKVRVREDLVEELANFEKYLEQSQSKSQKLQEEDLARLFKNFLDHQIPEDDNFLLTFVKGKFYRSSPRALPPVITMNSPLMEEWKTLQEKTEGESITDDISTGNILYIVKPLVINGQFIGTFVVIHTTKGEIREAEVVIYIVIKVLLVFIVLAMISTWFFSGKVLSPLTAFSETARSISEQDLDQRLKVEGSGEIAELAITFNEMIERLQKAFISQKAFINDAGHELRTPITIIRGNLELLGDDREEQKETVALVLDELDRMTRIVNDLLVLAKSERPDFLQWETVDIPTLTQEFFTKAMALGNRQWQLKCLTQGKLRVDRQRLTQAIMNLSENATQYTSEDDIIEIGSAIIGTTVHFWVRDTGEGMSPEDQLKVFDRFARAENSRRRSEGAGLGLSIVKAIALAHGGQVKLVSKLGKGSTFAVILPLNKSQGTRSEKKSRRF